MRRRRAERAALAAGLVAVYVVMGALASAGASDGVVYGVYVATATMLVLGTFGAARSAALEDWRTLGISIAIILVAAGSAFAGPRGVWRATALASASCSWRTAPLRVGGCAWLDQPHDG